MSASLFPALRRDVAVALYEAETENRGIEASIALNITAQAMVSRFQGLGVATPDGVVDGAAYMKRLFGLDAVPDRNL